MSNLIYLPVRAYHFKNSRYVLPAGCPICRAAREAFKVNDVSECVKWLTVDGTEYEHLPFTSKHYRYWRKRAEESAFDTSLLFSLPLRKIKTADDE